MTKEQIAAGIRRAMAGREYSGTLSPHVKRSIEEAASNYPAANLMAYLEDAGVRLVMTDRATGDDFRPSSVTEIHLVIGLLMERWNINWRKLYRLTGVYYSQPKDLPIAEYERSGRCPDGLEDFTLLSINTLLAVCEAIGCDLDFESV